jgi:hypothetical protein
MINKNKDFVTLEEFINFVFNTKELFKILMNKNSRVGKD